MTSKGGVPAQPSDSKQVKEPLTIKDSKVPVKDATGKPVDPKESNKVVEEHKSDPKAPNKPSTESPNDPKNLKPDPKPATGLGASEVKGPLIHIDNFDAKKFHVINSPRSREAMKELGILDADLHLKTADDLRGMFNVADPEEKKAFDFCVKKHDTVHKNIVKKISDRRKEKIRTKDEADKKKKDHDIQKNKQLKHLEEEKKAILKNLELDNKKREEEEKKKKFEHDKVNKKDTKQESSMQIEKSPKASDKTKKLEGNVDNQTKKPENHESAKSFSPNKAKGLSQRGKSAVSQKGGREKTVLKLEEELKNSSILQFLDTSAKQKELLDISLKERTKKDLERDKLRMKELMKKQKFELIEMSQKRNASAYKSHENLGNAKTRKIEYLYDLSRNPVVMMKERQQKEMEGMMNYEISLQVINFYFR